MVSRRTKPANIFLTVFAVAATSLNHNIAALDAVNPPRVARPSLVYDSRRHVTVLVGGVTDESVYLGTWEWDGHDWREKPGAEPPRRSSHGAVYDSDRGVVVLFGGQAADGHLLGDTWEYDGTQWRNVTSPGPTPREGFGLAYDSHRHQIVLFGGFGTTATSPFTDTWTYANGR